MWKILQYKKADDFVLATGKAFSVKEFVQIAFSFAKIKIIWKGKGINEKGVDKKDWENFGRNRQTILQTS